MEERRIESKEEHRTLSSFFYLFSSSSEDCNR